MFSVLGWWETETVIDVTWILHVFDRFQIMELSPYIRCLIFWKLDFTLVFLFCVTDQ